MPKKTVSKPKSSIRDEKRVSKMKKISKTGRLYTQSNIKPFKSASAARARMYPRTGTLPSKRR